jgi:hypothetical protein
MKTATAWAMIWLSILSAIVIFFIVVAYLFAIGVGVAALWAYSPLATVGLGVFLAVTGCACYQVYYH